MDSCTVISATIIATLITTAIVPIACDSEAIEAEINVIAAVFELATVCVFEAHIVFIKGVISLFGWEEI